MRITIYLAISQVYDLPVVTNVGWYVVISVGYGVVVVGMCVLVGGTVETAAKDGQEETPSRCVMSIYTLEVLYDSVSNIKHE